MTSGQVASMTWRFRATAFAGPAAIPRVPRRRTPPPTGSPLRVNEYAPTFLELGYDVTVVDDLFADVHRRAEGLESPLDHLHGAIDPGTVTAGAASRITFHDAIVVGATLCPSGSRTSTISTRAP